MMENLILESFSWKTEAFPPVDIGPNTIRIKGVALRSNTVSKNSRRYVEEEIERSGRTLIGKPLTVNHDHSQIIGHVDWAEPEGGVLEYLATVKKQPYVDLIRNRDPKIKGVSVDADYLHAQCVHCGARFLDLTKFSDHMVEAHGNKNFQIEPHQILFKELTLVVEPEVPGVSGTSAELTETYKSKGFSQLIEVLTKDRRENEKLKKANVNIQEEHTMAIGKSKTEQKPALKTKEQDEPEPEACPEGQHRDSESGECVPDEKPEAEEIKRKKITEPVEAVIEIPVIDKPVQEKLKLGEPFADYDSFADCVAKNQEKDDPEAYCASIKQQVEGETAPTDNYALEYFKLEQRKQFDRFKQEVKVLKHAVREYAKDIHALKEVARKDVLNAKKIEEAVNKTWQSISKVGEQYNKGIATIKGILEQKDLAWKNTSIKVEEIEKQIHTFKDLGLTWKKLEKDLVETKKAYETILGGMDERFKEYRMNMEQKLKDAEAVKLEKEKKIQETHEAETSKLEEKIDDIHSKLMRMPQFKGEVKTEKKKLMEGKHPYRGK